MTSRQSFLGPPSRLSRAALDPALGSLHGAALVLGLLWASSAAAVTLEVTPPPPTLEGEPTEFHATISEASESAQIRWDFGDGTQTEFSVDGHSVEHTFPGPGHYSVTALVDDNGSFASSSFVHAVYVQPTAAQPRTSSNLWLDTERGLVVTANPGNGTLSLVDRDTLEKVTEIQVFDDPVALAVAPDGKLWVVHRDLYAVSIVDLYERKMVDFFRLPYASQPVGLVFTPAGDALVTLFALGDVVKIDAASHEIVAQKHIAPFVRGLSVSGDGESAWISRFISSSDHGEVYRLSTASLEVLGRSDLEIDSVTEDTDHSGRGLPNYLFAPAITPDGTRAWIPSKKDNLLRGLERDGLALTQDNAVRPLISILDLETGEQVFDEHIDLDDRNLPTQVQFTPQGDWAFVSVYGSNLVELRDAFDHSFVAALRAEGLKGPRSIVIDGDRLFAFGELARKLVVFDIGDLLTGVDLATRVLREVPLVAQEKVPAEILRGQQVFANAEDKRMASEGYLSCDSCHFEGFEDGQVWDFFDRGEGFRNTTSMLARRGTGHGRLHWSGNFDELQDFDNPIRAHQGGLGFISAEKWATGTVSEPLGDPKAGLDTDLDALAAYVTSLSAVPRSPYRNPDGSLTEAAVAGRDIFLERGCDTCHAGADFTNSADGELFDVGTMTELSGGRLGGELPGIDTPTLLGVWQTAPYLHDGSAATLLDVLTLRNPDDLHGVTSDLSEEQLAQLVAYLQQIDGDVPPIELTLPGPAGSGGAGGTPGQGGALAAGGADAAGGDAGPSVGGSVAAPGGGSSGGSMDPPRSGGGCQVGGVGFLASRGFGSLALLLGFAVRGRLRRARRGSEPG